MIKMTKKKRTKRGKLVIINEDTITMAQVFLKKKWYNNKKIYIIIRIIILSHLVVLLFLFLSFYYRHLFVSSRYNTRIIIISYLE